MIPAEDCNLNDIMGMIIAADEGEDDILLICYLLLTTV